MAWRPRYVTFDCYGTLTRFRMGEMAREMFADRIEPEQMDRFVADFSSYRLDEVLGAWKPYVDVLKNAVRRTCKKWGLAYSEAEGQAYYDAVPAWGPHADVAAGLARIAPHIPLVILSTSPSSARPFMPSSRPRRRRPTSRACRPSSTCSINSVAHRGMSCTSPPACATT